MNEHPINKALAEELANKLGESNSIGFYYNLAKETDHQLLRDALAWVQDYKEPRNPAALFVWKVRNEISKRNAPQNNPQDEANKENYRKLREGLNLSLEKER